MLSSVLKLTKWQSLLIVYLLVVRPHVFHDGDFRWDFALGCPSFGEERANIWLVEICVVVGCVLASIDVVDCRMMEIVVV